MAIESTKGGGKTEEQEGQRETERKGHARGSKKRDTADTPSTRASTSLRTWDQPSFLLFHSFSFFSFFLISPRLIFLSPSPPSSSSISSSSTSLPHPHIYIYTPSDSLLSWISAFTLDIITLSRQGRKDITIHYRHFWRVCHVRDLTLACNRCIGSGNSFRTLTLLFYSLLVHGLSSNTTTSPDFIFVAVESVSSS